MRVLAIGAHPDDVELGCGGTLLRHRNSGDNITLFVMTTGERGPQASRPRVAEQEDAAAFLHADLLWGVSRTGQYLRATRRPNCSTLPSRVSVPMSSTTHAPSDTHQDHRASGSASLVAGRRTKKVLFYESPTSVDFRPTFFADMGCLLDEKLDLIRYRSGAEKRAG